MHQPSRRTFLKASAITLSAHALPKVSLGESLQEEHRSIDSYLQKLPDGNFESDAGHKIQLSREEGLNRLYAIAETKDAEVASIYVKGHNTWITTSKSSGENFALLCLEHADYLLKNNEEIEFFHTHVKPKDERIDNKYWWMVPGFYDLNRSIQYNNKFELLIKESIVTEHGTTTYWPKDLSWTNNLGDYRVAAMRYEAIVKGQAAALSSSLKNVTKIEDINGALKKGQDFLEMSFDKK